MKTPLEIRKKILIYVAFFMVCNLLLSILTTPPETTYSDGTVASPENVRLSLVITILLTVPVVGFICGLILAAFQYKDWTYTEKYVNVSFFAIMVMNIFILVSNVMNLMFGQ